MSYHHLRVSLLICTFIFTLCSGAIADSPDSFRAQHKINTSHTELYSPKKLKLYIGGFLGASYKVELTDQTLTYQEYASGQQLKTNQIIVPTKKQWQEFREALDSIQIWQWRKEYLNTSASDGTQWSVEIEYANRYIIASGNNRYPSDDSVNGDSDTAESSKVFTQYLLAVRNLLGEKKFQ